MRSSLDSLLVCGGRNYSDRDHAWGILTILDPQRIICGGAPGADSIAIEWAESWQIITTVYPADWDTHGKAAGPIRNQQMIDLETADLVLAFPGGRGTEDMIRRAKKAGIPVLRVD